MKPTNNSLYKTEFANLNHSFYNSYNHLFNDIRENILMEIEAKQIKIEDVAFAVGRDISFIIDSFIHPLLDFSVYLSILDFVLHYEKEEIVSFFPG